MLRPVAPWMVFVGAVLACATPVARRTPRTLVDADAELRRGCYECLIEARALYRRARADGDHDRALQGVFEADLLIALREMELGLPPSDALTDARRIVAEPGAVGAVEAGNYVDLVEEMAGYRVGPNRAPQRPSVAAERVRLDRGALSSSPVRRYLELGLDCEHLRGAPTRERDTTVAPLLRYRAASCVTEVSELLAVRAGEPRFVETSLFLAGAEVAQLLRDGTQSSQVKLHLDEFLRRFPSSWAGNGLTAEYYRMLGDDATALRFYERTLELRADHPQAALGRIISLTNLARVREAIDAASQVIEHNGEPLADAYYWRARNHRTLRELDAALQDVSRARELIGTEDVLLLAGIVEYERGDLDDADSDLSIVASLNAARCEAHWYLGLVASTSAQWSSSQQRFETAITCYRDQAASNKNKLRALEARADLDLAYRARAMSTVTASIEADTRQLHLAALAAGGSAASAGDFATARAHLQVASEDPDLADRVARLRTMLDRPRRHR